MPIEQLFRLQGVSKLFRSEIRRSNVLQQRMFLTPFPFGTPDMRFMCPVLWLERRLKERCPYDGRVRDESNGNDEDGAAMHFCPRLAVDDSNIGTPPLTWLHPEASWRQMKISCIEGSMLGAVKYDEVGQTGIAVGEVSWDGLHSDATLGELVDWLVRQFQGSYA